MSVTLGPRDLTSHQTGMLSAGDTDELAEELVAEEYGLLHRPDEREWYDCRHPRTNAKTEVKSTLRRIGDDYPAAGRFRLRGDQTRSLTSSDAAGVAWYVFVLFDLERGEIRMRRVKPSTVSGWVSDRGGWNAAGHTEFDEQHKLPWTEVFDK